MKKWSILLLFISYTWQSTFAQDTEPFSLDEAIDYAYQNSNQIKSAEYDLAYAKSQVKDYTSIGLPQVSAKVEYNYYIDLPTQIIPANAFDPMAPDDLFLEAQFGMKNSLTGSVTLSTLVFDGSYFVGLKAAKGLVELNRRQMGVTKQDIKYNVTNAYLTALLIQENIDVLQLNINNLQTTLSETKVFYDNGLVEQLDVDRLELSLANLQAELDVIQRQQALALNGLKFQMYFPLEQNIELTDSLSSLLTEANESDLTSEIQPGSRPELSMLEQSLYLNELNIKRYKMSYLPSLGAFATHQQMLQRNNLFDSDMPGFFPTTIVGLSLNIPIFDGFGTKAKTEMAMIDRDRLSLQIDDFERAVELEVTNARMQYYNAQERLKSQEKNLELAERIYNTTQIKYKEGVGSSLEMRQAEQELYTTQANYMNALYDLIVAKTALDKSLGK